jgi:hypothetical protein
MGGTRTTAWCPMMSASTTSKESPASHAGHLEENQH